LRKSPKDSPTWLRAVDEPEKPWPTSTSSPSAVGLVAKSGAGALPHLANPKILAEIFSDNASRQAHPPPSRSRRRVVAARVIENKPAELRPFESVRAVIEARYKRVEALKLAIADGEARLIGRPGRARKPGSSGPRRWR